MTICLFLPLLTIPLAKTYSVQTVIKPTNVRGTNEFSFTDVQFCFKLQNWDCDNMGYAVQFNKLIEAAGTE